VFVDEKKTTYKDLGFGQFTLFSALGAAVDKETQDITSRAKKEGITGNMKGDWYQLGGLLVVKKGEFSTNCCFEIIYSSAWKKS